MSKVFALGFDDCSANTTGGPFVGENSSTEKRDSERNPFTISAVSLSPEFWAETLGCLQSVLSCSTNRSLFLSINSERSFCALVLTSPSAAANRELPA